VNNVAQNNGATAIDGNEYDAAPFHFRIESRFQSNSFQASSTVAIMHGCAESHAAQEAGKAELSASR
jgi:hypothetical protein